MNIAPRAGLLACSWFCLLVALTACHPSDEGANLSTASTETAVGALPSAMPPSVAARKSSHLAPTVVTKTQLTKDGRAAANRADHLPYANPVDLG